MKEEVWEREWLEWPYGLISNCPSDGLFRHDRTYAHHVTCSSARELARRPVANPSSANRYVLIKLVYCFQL